MLCPYYITNITKRTLNGKITFNNIMNKIMKIKKFTNNIIFKIQYDKLV